jgi:hypothetical protein
MIVEKALAALLAKGADIKQIAADEFMVTDNGFFGFATLEDPFIVDGDGVLEIYDMYIEPEQGIGLDNLQRRFQ